MGSRVEPVEEPIATPRLVLVPVGRGDAEAILAGDRTRLPLAEGWPHDDSFDALRIAFGDGPGSLIWFVTLDGVVIGECGTLGLVDDAGDIEIGYGLAAEHRGFGFGNEVARALSEWLLAQPGVRRVVARRVLADNVPSRRALENAGFVLEREEDGLTWYALGG
jgi:RimJ/RimL family protein N-acetyltransferase